MAGSSLVSPRLPLLFFTVCVAAAFLLPMPVEGIRFTARPGRKCFTETLPEAGRYELHYKMARSLTPFVSVGVSAPGGRVIMEHAMAQADAKEIVTVENRGDIAICFNVAEKARHSATSFNVTLEVMDAEDAELTRQKRQSYSTSSVIAVGAGKASGALQQMDYIFHTMLRIRFAFTDLMDSDEDIRHSFKKMNAVVWKYVYVFAAMATLISLVTYFRLRHHFQLRKYI
ncbi:hypothetical protein TraAM80_04985 [Trypanosoma rangeli]|uniref:GOLD domain-containing protein n=1 Tax=Trypanosoma rangeli TaxID=5698 RepID=A0A422NHH2_TRYRA|nr:uncharacterized protein TraAM80_04985 [Trypanosoma rangeli]RNF04916.1 hypothetical protein TraAM80_04985 [Trypanosoma rangeli]|eukprot:RNF04916.1 hypothetical protein TraAM80_04985 [Trypanosoma rangeli]